MCGAGRGDADSEWMQGSRISTDLSRLCTGLAQCSARDHSLVHSDKSWGVTVPLTRAQPPLPLLQLQTDAVSRQRAELERLHAIPEI